MQGCCYGNSDVFVLHITELDFSFIGQAASMQTIVIFNTRLHTENYSFPVYYRCSLYRVWLELGSKTHVVLRGIQEKMESGVLRGFLMRCLVRFSGFIFISDLFFIMFAFNQLKVKHLEGFQDKKKYHGIVSDLPTEYIGTPIKQNIMTRDRCLEYDWWSSRHGTC